MSEPKRWDLWDVILEETDSKWVRYEDYARLKAELKVQNERINLRDNDVGQLFCENSRLKAEVERLRKAGDAMADEIIGCYNGEGYDPADSESLRKWNAAKEGKPSV